MDSNGAGWRQLAKMGGKEVQWLDLPPELWTEIAERQLPKEMDRLRFRSICSSWRSSIPPFHKPPLPCLPPPPLSRRQKKLRLIKRNVYLLQIPEDKCSNLEFKRRFLIKARKSSNKLCLESLLPNTKIDQYAKDKHFQPATSKANKVLDMWNLRVTELCTGFITHIKRKETRCLISHTGTTMAIHNERRLSYHKAGEKKWNTYDEASDWADVIDYQGQFCAIDLEGRTLLFDSSFPPAQISPPSDHIIEGKKRLVESCGDLFLFVQPIHKQPKVYRLKMEEKSWIEVKSLGDRMFFIGESCPFSASAKDFPGCKGNCVHYRDKGHLYEERLRYCGPDAAVYDLETGRFGGILSFPEHLKIFWPPPTWLEYPSPLVALLSFRTLIERTELAGPNLELSS